MANKKRPRGRPSEYKPEYCDALIEHFKNGDSYTIFAAQCGVHRDTLYDWEKQYPEFSEAKKRGWIWYQKYWEDAGKSGLYNETIKDGDGMTVTRSINSAVWIYNMKCRFKEDWTERKEIEAQVTHKDNDAEEVKELVKWLKSLKELP